MILICAPFLGNLKSFWQHHLFTPTWSCISHLLSHCDFPMNFLSSHFLEVSKAKPFNSLWDTIIFLRWNNVGFFLLVFCLFLGCVCVCCYCWAMWFFCIWVLRCFSRHAHPQCTCCCPWYWNAFSCLVGLNPGPFRYSFLWNSEMRPTCTYYCLQHPFV